MEFFLFAATAFVFSLLLLIPVCSSRTSATTDWPSHLYIPLPKDILSVYTLPISYYLCNSFPLTALRKGLSSCPPFSLIFLILRPTRVFELRVTFHHHSWAAICLLALLGHSRQGRRVFVILEPRDCERALGIVRKRYPGLGMCSLLGLFCPWAVELGRLKSWESRCLHHRTEGN
jgi:hypothetical protein